MTASPSESKDSAFQNVIYVGFHIENVLYGIVLVLYFKTIRILLGNRGAHKKSNLFYALFSSIMVFLVTVWIASSMIFAEKMWLLDANFPGGPDIYWKQNLSVWYMDWGTTGMILLQLMTDGLMIYRCRIIWNSYRAIVVPVFLWLSTLVLGILVDWTSSVPGGDLFAGVASQLALGYYTASVSLSTILSCMICYRVLLHGRRIREHLGKEYANLYFTIVTLVVESILPYTLCGIATLVSLGVGSPMSVVFVCVYSLMMCISPQMLILRLLRGRAWDNDTTKGPVTSMKFSPCLSWRSEGIDSGEASVHLQTLSKVYAPGRHDKSVIAPV